MVTISGRLPSVRNSPRGREIPTSSFLENSEYHDVRSDQHSWCNEDHVNCPVQLIDYKSKQAQHRCWLQEITQSKSEAADHKLQAYVLATHDVQQLRPEFDLMSVKNVGEQE